MTDELLAAVGRATAWCGEQAATGEDKKPRLPCTPLRLFNVFPACSQAQLNASQPQRPLHCPIAALQAAAAAAGHPAGTPRGACNLAATRWITFSTHPQAVRAGVAGVRPPRACGGVLRHPALLPCGRRGLQIVVGVAEVLLKPLSRQRGCWQALAALGRRRPARPMPPLLEPCAPPGTVGCVHCT